jgi:hypothetical protein
VVKTKPVTNFVSQSFALIVISQGAAWDSPVENNNAIVGGVAAVGGREGSIAKEALRSNASKAGGVDIKGSGISSLAKSALHRSLIGGVAALGTGEVKPVSTNEYQYMARIIVGDNQHTR